MTIIDDTLRQLGRGDRHQRHLASQIRTLQKEIDKLARRARHEGHDLIEEFGDGASDLFDEAVDFGRHAARNVSKQAIAAGKVVQRDPVPVLIAVGTVALVASLLLSRR